AAARMSCQNNLKQLGTAIHNYASGNNDKLPPTVAYDTSKGYQTFYYQLLPYIEQTALYNQGNYNYYVAVKAFQCPSDTSHNNGICQSTSMGGTSYLANYYVFWTPLTYNSSASASLPTCKYTIGNIPDGTSNTIGMVERYMAPSGYGNSWCYYYN